MGVLVKSDWKRLKSINLNYNYVGMDGIRLLSRNTWSNKLTLSAVFNIDYYNNLLNFEVLGIEGILKSK